MSLSAYTFYNWLIFIWGSIGMLFIAVVSIREVVEQIKAVRAKGKQLSQTDQNSM
ncbi:hypothetical protein KDJ56_08910 [Brevibacillus composti]|uniref:Heme exporter protein D n=1 Tax=Brevibacillus composti TaxID=2796470 RepID=A0A7T5ENT3_9BACL|nr:hypothetical protein [Brevibacillus composti]QQE76023.1 hypothetical protein JD108_09230 [Brevibacillus composti]QUO43049.1 hypothetical protein KDJ56_08910 [Brevibacillus composti]